MNLVLSHLEMGQSKVRKTMWEIGTEASKSPGSMTQG